MERASADRHEMLSLFFTMERERRENKIVRFRITIPSSSSSYLRCTVPPSQFPSCLAFLCLFLSKGSPPLSISMVTGGDSPSGIFRTSYLDHNNSLKSINCHGNHGCGLGLPYGTVE
ncbi:uncharacterized protein BO72DRAFT_21028 [Aspergillus fijiensis CBS 313.89]|uniref:Uncharacterized protein n=1 Tax=Aspergillus fijiensis CBS 313.89 TaxID=1448319 RepID=A0A8G1REC6_9EURO|nr:uncharacterized protein BO72DRAFT_21028 [Aspergillus fijiensis CBS 313.89]RAK71218.1 hypothetical protein BO72DRAFT_21028 [Aspergillus fijiensis CBS 313.89]